MRHITPDGGILKTTHLGVEGGVKSLRYVIELANDTKAKTAKPL